MKKALTLTILGTILLSSCISNNTKDNKTKDINSSSTGTTKTVEYKELNSNESSTSISTSWENTTINISNEKTWRDIVEIDLKDQNQKIKITPEQIETEGLSIEL